MHGAQARCHIYNISGLFFIIFIFKNAPGFPNANCVAYYFSKVASVEAVFWSEKTAVKLQREWRDTEND